MTLRVTLIQGGGIGLDQVPAVQRILEAAGVAIEWDEHLAGLASIETGGPPLPEAHAALGPRAPAWLSRPSCCRRRARVRPQGNFNVQFRRELGLFASVRPLKNLRGLPARFTGVDMLVIRELTEDLYAAIEHEIVPGVVQSIKVVTEAACRRFFRFAFEWARTAGRKLVHLRPQGEHPQAGRRPVPGSLPLSRQRLPGDANARNHRGQLLHADGVQAAAVRRAGDGEPLRRPGERPGRGHGRRHQRHGGHQRAATGFASTSRSTAAAATSSARTAPTPCRYCFPPSTCSKRMACRPPRGGSSPPWKPPSTRNKCEPTTSAAWPRPRK